MQQLLYFDDEKGKQKFTKLKLSDEITYKVG